MSASSKGSALARGASMVADLWQKLDQRVKARGGTDEDMHRLATGEGEAILDMVAYHLEKAGAVKRNCYPVKVSHTTLAAAIEAGTYDEVDENITAANFKIDGEIIVDVKLELYYPDRDISFEEVVHELDRLGLRPATLQELCAFGEKYPDIQCEFPVAALGSVWSNSSGYHGVPYLDYWEEERRLDLGRWGNKWNTDLRFLAVRKPACRAGR